MARVISWPVPLTSMAIIAPDKAMARAIKICDPINEGPPPLDSLFIKRINQAREKGKPIYQAWNGKQVERRDNLAGVKAK